MCPCCFLNFQGLGQGDTIRKKWLALKAEWAGFLGTSYKHGRIVVLCSNNCWGAVRSLADWAPEDVPFSFVD